MGVLKAIPVHGVGVNRVVNEDEKSVDYLMVMRKHFIPVMVKVETECLSWRLFGYPDKVEG